MGIDTISTIQGGYYGILVKQKNGFAFSSQGKLPILEEILECIEDDSVHLKLSTPCHGHRKVAYIKHGDLLDPQMCRELADLGFDVTRRIAEHFVDAIRLQEEALEDRGTVPTAAYASLGWIQIPSKDPNTGQLASKLCYRSF